MSDENQGLAARGKMLGALLRDARQAKAKTADECAQMLGADADSYAAYEAGQASPSLPELELLAYHLDTPLSYFWGQRPAPEKPSNGHRAPNAAELAALRDRIIGAQVRQARHSARLTLPDLASALGRPPEQVAAYELGQWSIPLPELEAIASRLGLTVEHFFESEGTLGEWTSWQRASERLREMPPELREFVSQPANESYLRLAHQLSQLPLDRLRALAESLLEITL